RQAAHCRLGRVDARHDAAPELVPFTAPPLLRRVISGCRRACCLFMRVVEGHVPIFLLRFFELPSFLVIFLTLPATAVSAPALSFSARPFHSSNIVAEPPLLLFMLCARYPHPTPYLSSLPSLQFAGLNPCCCGSTIRSARSCGGLSVETGLAMRGSCLCSS
ncbi:hypothetical protein AMAG_18498, partial [Allomyces macrogynus ATCC 38327]